MKIYTVAEQKKFLAERESRLAHDAAFTFRMGAGFPGMMTRTHPQWIEAALVDSTKPPTFYGQAVFADAASPQGVRVPATGDSSAVDIYGIVVRPFPIQQSTTANFAGGIALGTQVAPPATGVIDIMRAGSIIVTLQGAAAAAKGSQVYVCVVAGTGYVVGGFSADTVSGTFATLSLPRYAFNGPADANGLVELIKMA